MASKDEIRRVSIYINGEESDLTLKKLAQGSNKLRNELANLTIGTEEYVNKSEELQKVNALLQGLRRDVSGVEDSFARLKDGLSDIKATLIAALSVEGAIEAAKALIVQNGEMSDTLGDVQKSTGLTQASVRHLSEDLKKLNTRTAQEELLGLAFVAGKLGISAEKDVLAFVRAADQINVALGEDLGGAEEAINSLGKLTDIFKIKDEFGLEKSLLKVGSAINDIGASGTASEAYLVEFAGRLAGIAPAAEISIQNVIGMAAVFDELSQPVEASTTAIGQFVVGMGKDIPKFAAIAKMSIKDFSNLLSTDGNVALVKVLTSLKSTGQGVEGLAASMGMVGEDGAKAITALGLLTNNLELLKTRQDQSNDSFEKSTSLTAEFNVKNNNLAATLDKIGNFFANMATTGVITNVVTTAVEGFAKWLGLIKPLSADLEEQKIRLLGLRIELESNNTTEARRAEILGELKTQYPGYLGQIDAERAKNSDLLPILEKINGQYVLRIAYQKRMEKLDEAIKDEAEGINDVYDAQQKLIMQVAKVQEELSNDGIKFTIKGANEQEKAYYIYRNLNAELRKQAVTSNELNKIVASGKYDGMISTLNSYGNSVKSATANLNDYKKTRTEIENEATKFKNSAGDLGEKPTAPDKKKEKKVVATVDTTIAARRVFLQNQIKGLEADYEKLNETDSKGQAANIAKRKEYQQQLDALSGSTKAPKRDTAAEKAKHLFEAAEQERISSLQRTAQAIMDSYGAELSQTDEHFRQLQHKHSTNAAAVAQIEQERVAKIKQIQEKFQKEDVATLTAVQNEISQIATSAMKRDTDRQIAELQQATDLKIQQLDKEDNLIREKIEKQQAEIVQLQKSGKDDEAALLQQAVARELDILDASGKLRAQFLKSQGDKELKITKTAADSKKLAELEAAVINADSANPNSQSAIAAHVALLDEKHRLEVEKAEETGQAVAAIDAKYNADKKALLESGEASARDFAVQMAQEATNSVFSIMANNRQAELTASLDAIESQREKELSNKKLTEAQKKIINDKYDNQVKAEKTKAWKAEQRASITQALINGAIGVTAAWTNPFTAPFVIPTIIATTAAQIAVIAAQEVPKYEDGGFSAMDYKGEDRSAPAGYVRRPTLFSNSSSGRSFIAGEGYKTEYIISSEQLKDPAIADFVNSIEAIRGVKRFEAGGYSNSQAPALSSTTAILPPVTQVNINTAVLEEKMDRFIRAADNAWNYRTFEEKQIEILDARNNASV